MPVTQNQLNQGKANLLDRLCRRCDRLDREAFRAFVAAVAVRRRKNATGQAREIAHAVCLDVFAELYADEMAAAGVTDPRDLLGAGDNAFRHWVYDGASYHQDDPDIGITDDDVFSAGDA